MQQSNGVNNAAAGGTGITRQMSNSMGSQTESNNPTHQQQQQSSRTTIEAGGWRCEVFVDTPMTRELMHGPLNIHLPPIQLPSGLQNLVGQLTDAGTNQHSLQRQTSLVIGDGIASLSASQQQSSTRTIGPTNAPIREDDTAQSMQQPQSPASPLESNSISWGRASSTPAMMNSSGSGTTFSTSDSFVIDINEDEQGNNRIHRRRSSSPLRPVSAQRQHSEQSSPNFSALVPTNSIPAGPQLTQRSVAASTANNGGGTDRATADGTTSTGDGRSDGEEDEVNLRSLRIRLQELLRRRHQIIRNIISHTGEFPSLYAFGVFLSWLFVIIFVLIQFFTIEFTACLSLLFCIFHYSDIIAFKRYVSGAGSAWFIAGKIALRQFMVLQVLGQSSYVLPTAIYQNVATSASIPHPTFWSTLYIVFITEYFIMDCLLIAKILVSNLPKCSTIYKRRLYQWLEYSGAIYRFSVPFVQWNAYLDALWWTVLYGGIKILLGLAMAWGWLLTTMRIFRATHLGSAPSDAECKQHEQCTICFGEFTSPIKLKCDHIYCSECIRTWLDREHTCPICRAIVSKEDNNYRNGESMFPVLF